MNLINDRIKYLPASENPLSADVYFIEGEKYCYIYDVGNNENSEYHINQTNKEKTIILSHYHKDHTGNIDCLNYHDLYVGDKTYETISKGNVVSDTVTIKDGVKIEIIHCPSPHTDGSIIINVDNEYTLIADLYFTRPPVNNEKAIQMINSLKNIDTKYFVVSHLKDEKIISKEKLVLELMDYFNQ